MKHIRRFYSSLALPWKFGNSKAYELPPVNDCFNNELLEDKQHFLIIYDKILNSYKNQDIEWLGEITEPNLYRKLKIGIKELRTNDRRIKVINEKESNDLAYHNAICYIGAKIDRSKNKRLHEKQLSHSLGPWDRTSSLVRCGIEGASVLKVDVIYASKKKLLLLDKRGNIIEGDNNENLEYHKFQFEKMWEHSAMGFFKIINWNCFRGKNIFKDSDWVLTDIDDSLEGNPFKIEEEL